MKLFNFMLNNLINKLTKTNYFFTEFNKAPIYFAMIKSKLLRHAQTQHSDESFDLDNILLCKANIFQLSADPDQPKSENETTVEISRSNDKFVAETTISMSLESKNCVLFFKVENSLTENQIPLSNEEKELKNSITEKRKAEDTELLQDVKKPKLEIKRPGLTEERYLETSYYIENGLRKVYPYNFTFTTFTKGRWVGEKILNVFTREFRAHASEEYKRSIEVGKLTVNNEKVPVDYILKHNDLLANTVHRHELPVTSQPVAIVHIDDDIVVVNKPASIPVHPCGRYRHNTIVFILAKEYNLKNLRTIHRLDRLTSGLLLFGRNSRKANEMECQIRNRQVQKAYICRVEGEFPDGVVECNEPIAVISHKIGVCKVSAKGKDCKTTFEKMSYNGKTSVVLCKPLTGRMHQIRVHLQFLGFPVSNDPLYNHEVFGPLKGRGGDTGGKTDEELVNDLINIHNADNWLGIEGDSEISMFKTIKENCAAKSESLSVETNHEYVNDDNLEKTSLANTSISLHAKDVDSLKNNSSSNEYETNGSISPLKKEVATQTGHEVPDTTFNPEKMIPDKYCNECKIRYKDPQPKDLVMYLHAWKYQGAGWEYETPLPNWGSADWIEDN